MFSSNILKTITNIYMLQKPKFRPYFTVQKSIETWKSTKMYLCHYISEATICDIVISEMHRGEQNMVTTEADECMWLYQDSAWCIEGICDKSMTDRLNPLEVRWGIKHPITILLRFVEKTWNQLRIFLFRSHPFMTSTRKLIFCTPAARMHPYGLLPPPPPPTVRSPTRL